VDTDGRNASQLRCRYTTLGTLAPKALQGMWGGGSRYWSDDEKWGLSLE